jgi:nitrate/nitrite transport system permease protein
MSEQTTVEKFKYGLLKAIDVSGFKVFDPVVRLFFGEEPQKQVKDITRFMLMPIVFVFCCLVVWNFVAPRHKTKSGEVPTPAQVWTALNVNDTLHDRENEKESDFALSDEAREARIEEIKALVVEREKDSKRLKEELAIVEADVKEEKAAALEPLKKEYSDLKAAHKEARSNRKAEAEKLAEAVAEKAKTSEDLLVFLRESNELKDGEKAKEQILKDQIAEINNNKPKALQSAAMASDSMATEVQHLKKRLDYLTSGNRSLKVAKAKDSASTALETLESADSPAAILAAAKTVVKNEERASKIAKQEYPRASTIWFQMWRSLFTVFIGFILAAVFAIPIGIMCGLNRVAMACLTPIISIFKPVSPVVWLLIFQIVVGAFFPNPETHPFFVFLNSLPIVGWLNANPALIFSACTVAMCALWPALVNTALGVSSVENDHINVAKVLRLGLWSRLTKIIIPSSLPLVFAGLRISLGVGWMVLIAAEALSSSEGLGKYVWDQYQNGSSLTFANILLACFVIGIIGFFLDRIMIVLQRAVSFDDGAATV